MSICNFGYYFIINSAKIDTDQASYPSATVPLYLIKIDAITRTFTDNIKKYNKQHQNYFFFKISIKASDLDVSFYGNTLP